MIQLLILFFFSLLNDGKAEINYIRISDYHLMFSKKYSNSKCTYKIETLSKNDSLNCIHYSDVLGFKIENIENLVLYKTIVYWIGKPYKYAGEDINGIDCSGFATVLYDSAYKIQLKGGSEDIFTKVKPLKRSELSEGDLVFFKIKDNKISHVGVYLINNKFVHATRKAGVIISDLDEPYYKKYFYKGGRIIYDTSREEIGF